jgi:hypothetical protein
MFKIEQMTVETERPFWKGNNHGRYDFDKDTEKNFEFLAFVDGGGCCSPHGSEIYCDWQKRGDCRDLQGPGERC